MPDILLLRELCDEYLRIENDMRKDELTLTQKRDLVQEMAITMKALRQHMID